MSSEISFERRRRPVLEPENYTPNGNNEKLDHTHLRFLRVSLVLLGPFTRRRERTAIKTFNFTPLPSTLLRVRTAEKISSILFRQSYKTVCPAKTALK